MNIDHPFILSILTNYHQVVQKGKRVQFCWVPSHIGIHGNNKADMAAKSALQFEVTTFKFPYTDLKSFVKFYTNSLWQIFWDFCDRNKLYCIQNKVNKP